MLRAVRRVCFLYSNQRFGSQLGRAFDTMFTFFFYVVLFVTIVAIMGLDPFVMIASFSGFIVGFAFMINIACSSWVQGVLLILVRRPYDIGDRYEALILPCRCVAEPCSRRGACEAHTSVFSPGYTSATHGLTRTTPAAPAGSSKTLTCSAQPSSWVRRMKLRRTTTVRSPTSGSSTRPDPTRLSWLSR